MDIKKVVGITIILLIFIMNISYSQKEDLNYAELKKNVFKVLNSQCNTCHSTKRRTNIFTLENMDSLARDINTQVFVKRKMPKGNKAKLSETETKAIKEWLRVVLKID